MFVLWVGSWLTLSGAFTKMSDWSHEKTLNQTAEAGFAVQNILVEGRVNTDPDMIKAILNIEKGDSVFALEPASAKELLEKISWVKSAQVERRLPDTIYVGLVERQPIALWQKNQKLHLIDREGVVLTDDGLERFRDMLIVVGDEAPAHTEALLAMLSAEPGLKGRIDSAAWVGGRRWDLMVDGRIAVKLPEADIGYALARLAAAQSEDAILDKDIEAIDLREEGRLTVKTRPGAVNEYQANFKGGAPI